MNNFANATSRVQFDRPIYEQGELNEEFKFSKKQRKNWRDRLSSGFKCEPKELLTSTVPAIGWLSHYDWRNDLVKDLISGVTVAIMHIPQGMGYAMLGNVPPVVGLYMAFFPILIYSFLGTSRHNSMGTFAVICLMTGKVVLQNVPHHLVDDDDARIANRTDDPSTTFYTPLQVATTVTFVVGLLQIGMYLLRLGIVSVLLSDTLVSGFTTGAAVHVLVSQLKDLFGIGIPKNTGYFTVVKDTMDIVERLPNLNYAATVVSAITIVVMVLNNECLKPKAAKLCSFPIPIELIAIVCGTAISHFVDLSSLYGVKIIGEIAKGIPDPVEPTYSLIPSILMDSLWIAIVSYTITISMALIFAKKQNYDVDANQELLAMGASNLLGAHFQCMPIAASLSRSTIQENIGGRTQMTSFVSCTILLFVLLWIGPYFETLPRAVLASIIIVALKGMLFQVKDLAKFYKSSKLDAAVWSITFAAVVFVSIDVGLMAGILMSLGTILLLAFVPYTCLLGHVPHTDLYLDVSRYEGVTEITGLKIFHYQGAINFATRTLFKSALYEKIDLVPQKELAHRQKLEKLLRENCEQNELDNYKKEVMKVSGRLNVTLKCLVIDLSAVSFIDQSGISMVKDVIEEFNRINIVCYISGCSAPIYEKICKVEYFNKKTEQCKLFPTLNDAVLSARYNVRQESNANISVITRI